MTVKPTYEITALTMDPEVKKLWVAALRNPEAKQIKSFLRTEEGNCCLGIACDLAVENKVISEPVRFYDGESGCTTFEYETKDSLLPFEVAEWMGFIPEIDSPSFQIRRYSVVLECYNTDTILLTVLNDRYGLTFSQIADIVDYVF